MRLLGALVLVVSLLTTDSCHAAMMVPSLDGVPADLLFEGAPGNGVEDGPAWGRFLRPARHGYRMLYLSRFRPYEEGYRLDLTVPVPLGWTFSIGDWHGLTFYQRITRNLVQFLETHGTSGQSSAGYPLRLVDFLDHLPAESIFADALSNERFESFDFLQKFYVSVKMLSEFLAGTAEGKAIFVFDETEGFGNPGGDPFYLADAECYVEKEWSSETTHARVTLADGTAAGIFFCERDRSVYSLLGFATVELTFKFLGSEFDLLTDFVSFEDEDSYLAGIRTSTDSVLTDGLAALNGTGNAGGSGSLAGPAGSSSFGNASFGSGAAGGGGGSGGGAPGGSSGFGGAVGSSTLLLLTSTSSSPDGASGGGGSSTPGSPGGMSGGGAGGDGGGTVITVDEPNGTMLILVAACLLLVWKRFLLRFPLSNRPGVAA